MATDQTARSPLQALVLAFWFARPAEGVARILQCALLIANVGTFALLAARLLGTRAAGLVATVCAFATLQIRFGNDAILGSTATSTIGCEFILLALLAWLRFAEKATLARFCVALAAYAMALAGDASAMALIVIAPILFAMQNGWSPGKRFMGIAAFITVGAILLAADYAFAPGSIVLPSIGAILGQSAAAVPLVYRALHALIPGGASATGSPPDRRFLDVAGAGIPGFLLATGGMAAAYIAMRYYLAPSPRASMIRSCTIGAALWIVPSFLAGHASAAMTQPLPTVYVQSFGVALLLTTGLAAIARQALGRATGFVAIALLFIGLTLLGNSAAARLVAHQVSLTNAVRTAIERAGSAGIFETLSGGSTVALDAKSYPFRFTPDWRNASYLLYTYAGRDYEMIPVIALRPAMAKSDTWIMRYSENAMEGLQQLSFGRYSRGVPANLQIDQSIAYQHYTTSDLRAEGLGVIDAGGRGMSAATSAIGETGAIVLVRRTCGPVDESLALLPTTPEIRFGPGFLPDMDYVPADIILSEENYIQTPHFWRYMGRSGELAVERDSCRQTPLILTMTLASAAPTIVRISAPGRVGLYSISQYPEAVQFEIPDNGQRNVRVRIETNGPTARLYDGAWRRESHDFRPDTRLFVSKPEARYS